MVFVPPTHAQINGHFVYNRQELRDLQEGLGPVVAAFADSFKRVNSALPKDMFEDLSCIKETDRKELIEILGKLAKRSSVSVDFLLKMFLVNVRDMLCLKDVEGPDGPAYKMPEKLSQRDLIVQNLRAEIVISIAKVSRSIPDIVLAKFSSRRYLNQKAYIKMTRNHIKEYIETGHLDSGNTDPRKIKKFVKDLAREVLRSIPNRGNMVRRMLGIGVKRGALDLSYALACCHKQNLKNIS